MIVQNKKNKNKIKQIIQPLNTQNMNCADFRAIRHRQFRTVNRLGTSRYRECAWDRSRHVKCTDTIEHGNHRFTNARRDY